MAKFIIPGRLPGLNELLGSSSRHWAVAGRIKKQAMEEVQWAAKAAKIRPFTGLVKVSITCYEPNRKRDKDNVTAGATKIILDALQAAGIIAGDGWKYVEGPPLVAVDLDRQRPRVEVVIEEAG